jgi:predicted lipid carrier protein YhbT
MLQRTSQQVLRLPGIVSWVVRPLPLLPLQIALERLLAGILERHPDLVGRLTGIERRRIAVDPNDLPFLIVLEPRDGSMSLRLARTLETEDVHARISGPLRALIGLVDGVYDGDALFFSRDLIIEGDIEAVLALRNAIDDADVDMLGEVTATCAAYAPPIDRVTRILASLLHRPTPGSGAKANRRRAQ